MNRESTKILCRVQYFSTGEVGSKITLRPHYHTRRAAGEPCIEMRVRSDLWTSRAILEKCCTLHRIFVLSGMATVSLTDFFFNQWPLCTLLAGSNLSLYSIREFCTVKFFFFFCSRSLKYLMPGKTIVPAFHCRVKKCTLHLSTREKIVPGSSGF